MKSCGFMPLSRLETFSEAIICAWRRGHCAAKGSKPPLGPFAAMVLLPEASPAVGRAEAPTRAQVPTRPLGSHRVPARSLPESSG